MTTTYLNPPFDKRMLTIGPPSTGSKHLKRGRMVVAQGHRKGQAVRFLYNPVEISVQHTIDPNGVLDPSKRQKVPHPTKVGQLVNIGGVSIQLLYDRTYELWDRALAPSTAGRYGVYADVLAYYRCLGIVGSKTTKSGGGKSPNNGTLDDTEFDLFPVAPIDPTQTYWLYIGNTMRFYGTLTDFEITYTHWSNKMVPTRCAVSMSMQFMSQLPKDRVKGHDRTPDKNAGGKHTQRPNPTKNKPHTLPGGQ